MLENPATCKIKLIDFGVARYISGTSNVTVMVGTPEFAGRSVLIPSQLCFTILQHLRC